jgi:hypothetical protein
MPVMQNKLRAKSVLFPNDSLKVTRELDPKFRVVPQASVVSLATCNNERPPHSQLRRIWTYAASLYSLTLSGLTR